MQLDNLQLAVNAATAAVNTQGPLLNNCLNDVPARVQEIALHDIRCGAAVALATTQVQTGHDLRTMEPSFPMADDPDLIEDFDDDAAAIMDITSA